MSKFNKLEITQN